VERFTYPFFAFPREGDKTMNDDQMSSSDIFIPDVRTMTIIETPKGQIDVIHEITLGDLLVSTSLVAVLIFMVISRVIRR
jgi:hypothetical protein